VSGTRAVATDAVRLCLGTLTVLPVGAPERVDRSRAAAAMSAAPVAGLLVGAAAGATAGVGSLAGLPALVVGVLAVAAGALATRFLHLDGLADTADGWGAAAHGHRDRALEVMRRGDVGPVGAGALVLVLLAQAASVGSLVTAQGPGAGLVVACAWAGSRAVVPLLCTRWFRSARAGGLGAAVIGTVPVAAALAVAVALAGGIAVAIGAAAAGAAVVALATGAGLGLAVQRRLGGLTGDVLGAGVEVTLTVLLAALAALAGPGGAVPGPLS
jgi:adenosylcobinamide-GDP ribazoletransferase